MMNRFEHEFPPARRRHAPLDGHDRHHHIARARQLRADALAHGLRSVARMLGAGFQMLRRFMQCAAIGASLRPPEIRGGRATAGCR